MSTELDEAMAGTKPSPQHQWLQQFVGEWETESQMMMGEESSHGKGSETVTDLGGLWAFGEGKAGNDAFSMEYKWALGYDVSFNEYRGCWFASMSSHLWKQTGTLSEDGKKMELVCEGPNMDPTKDALTAMYKDVLELIDADHRTMTSYGQNDEGGWDAFMKVSYTRKK